MIRSVVYLKGIPSLIFAWSTNFCYGQNWSLDISCQPWWPINNSEWPYLQAERLTLRKLCEGVGSEPRCPPCRAKENGRCGEAEPNSLLIPCWSLVGHLWSVRSIGLVENVVVCINTQSYWVHLKDELVEHTIWAKTCFISNQIIISC